MSHTESKDMENLAEAIKACEVQETEDPPVVMNHTYDKELLSKFPKPKNAVPPIFLHNPDSFVPHVRKVINMGIKFYKPILGKNYTKICCEGFNDHKALLQYFENKHLAYHTFGHPDKRKMKVVLKGLPKDVDLDVLKKVFILASVPVVRMHTMHNIERARNLPTLVLAVVPNNDEGRKILLVQKLFGHDIKIEPPKARPKQCYRCQKWGHSQRYCHGRVLCVKCGNDHLYKKCPRDPAKLPPKCANCRQEHTSNYKLCPYSPSSPEYIKKMQTATKTVFPVSTTKKKVVTIEDCRIFMRGYC